MLTILLILCVLIWVPIMFHQINNRGFLILVIWLFIAPVVTNVAQGDANPFFTTPEAHEGYVALKAKQGPPGQQYKTGATTITLRDLLEPNRLVLSAILVVILLIALLKKENLVNVDMTETWMIVFSLIVVASVLLQSNRQAFGLRTVADAFIVPFLGYYVARKLVTSEDRLRKLTQVIGYTGFYVIIICLIERLAYSELVHRLSGPFGYPGNLHIVLTAVLYAVLSEKEVLPRNIRLFVLYLIPIIVLLTWARGVWIGFLGGMWVFLLLGRRLIDRSQKLVTIGLALIVVAVIGLGVQHFESQEITGRVTERGTVDWRLSRWTIAIEEGIEHPIFGLGLNNLRGATGRRGLNYVSAHTSFLSLFAELGAVGLLAYLAIVASIIRMGLRLYRTSPHARDRWRGIAVISIFAAYQIPAVFSNTLYSTDLGHVYVYVFVGGVAGLYSRHSSHAVASRTATGSRLSSSELKVKGGEGEARYAWRR